MKLSQHTLEKSIPKRHITKEQVVETINKNNPFKYFHKGEWQTGFYDKVTKIFVGKGNKITTTMKAAEKYIENLLKKTP